MVICLERGADLHMAQLMPLPLTISCFSKIQIGFTFVVPAHPGSPGQRAVKRVCVCISLYHFCFCVSFFSTKPSDWLGRMSVMAYFVTSGAYNLSVVSFRPRNVVLIWKTRTICIVSCLTTATWSAGSTTRRRSSRLMTLPRTWPGPSHCLRNIRNTRSKSWRLFFRYKFINFITNFITLLIH